MEINLDTLFSKNGYDEQINNSRVVRPKKDKVQKALKRFQTMWDAADRYFKKAKEYDRFYDGDQLSQKERRVLNERSQPDIVINRIKPRIDVVMGLQEKFRQRMKVFHRNESEDDQLTAEAFTEALRFVDQTNKVEYVEGEVFEDGVIAGRGWFAPMVELNDEFEPEIRIKRISYKDMLIDPESKEYDLADCRDLAHTVWFDEDDLIALFPKKERTIKKMSASFFEDVATYSPVQTTKYAGDDYLAKLFSDENVRNLYYDCKNKKLRVLNYWYKRQESRTMILHPDLGMGMIGPGISKKQIDQALRDIAEQTQIPPEVFERTMPIMKVCTLIGGEELEEKDSPYLHQKFPFVQYRCFMDRSTNEPYGLVRQAIDPQSEVNKRRSKALHILNSQRIIMEDGAVDDEEKLRRESNRSDGIVKTNRGFKLEITRDTEIGNAQLSLYQESIREIDDCMGINEDVIGAATNARTGAALDRRIEQGLAVLARVFSNWRRSNQMVREQVLELVQQFWTDEKAIRVTDDQNVTKFLRLNQKVLIGGKEVTMRNVRTGKYDVVIDQADSVNNMGDDTFKELAKLAQTGQLPPDIVMEFAPVPHAIKQRILQRLQPQQAPAPGAQGSPDAGQQPSPEQLNALAAEGQLPPQ